MPPKKNKTGKCTPNDKVYTPQPIAKQICEHFVSQITNKIVLEPCSGKGVIVGEILKLNPSSLHHCEIDMGLDLFAFNTKVDTVITNPPYSIFDTFLKHIISLNPENIILIIPPAKLFASLGVMRTWTPKYEIVKQVLIGGGGKLGFPFGFPVSAVYLKRQNSGVNITLDIR